MKISDKGLNLIKSFEGCELEAYPDPGSGGDPWTIGFGHTGKVFPGMKITAEEAERFLEMDVEHFERCVEEMLEVEVSQDQFDALVCFAYNVGCKALQGSTLLRLVNSRQFEAAAQQFLRWNKAGGKVLAGLTRRRQAESELFAA
jgi:lysozyme